MPMVGNGVCGLSWFSRLGLFLGMASCGGVVAEVMFQVVYCGLELAGLSL